MIRTPNPKLRMLAGPNGSGKSTLFRSLRTVHSFPFGYCLNPDEIDRELTMFGRLYLGGWGVQLSDAAIASFVRSHGLGRLLPDALPKVEGNALVAPKRYRTGYFISVLSDLLRREWMAKEESFTFETVMSHPGRIDGLADALARGYRTYLYYVCTNSAQINARRIANRVERGGHDVAGDKVRDRYRRSLDLLPRAIGLSTRAYVFDNSGSEQRLIAEYEEGTLVKAVANLPAWFVNAVFPARRGKKGRS
jgi:predicted ABC-type ATPase